MQTMRRTCVVLIVGMMGCANTNPQPVEPVSASDKEPRVASASAAPTTSEAPPVASAPEPEPEAPKPPKFPVVEGTLEGKPFEIKGAATTGPLKDGRVSISLTSYPIDCDEHEPAEGERTIAVVVPWKSGESVDVAKLGAKGAYATRTGPGGKVTSIKGFKPSGTVEVLGAPGEAGRTGRIRFDINSGKDAVEGEVPVRVCF